MVPVGERGHGFIVHRQDSPDLWWEAWQPCARPGRGLVAATPAGKACGEALAGGGVTLRAAWLNHLTPWQQKSFFLEQNLLPAMKILRLSSMKD